MNNGAILQLLALKICCTLELFYIRVYKSTLNIETKIEILKKLTLTRFSMF